MIRINKDSDWYSVIADSIATFFGFGAWNLIGGFCNKVINESEVGTTKKLGMKAGKCGLQSVALYSTAQKVREEIDELTDAFNELMGVIEMYQREKQSNDIFEEEDE